MLRRRLGFYPRIARPMPPPALSADVQASLRAFLMTWPSFAQEQAETVRRGIAVFAGHEESIAEGCPWNHTAAPRLWRYHLHGFDHIIPLLVNGQDEDGDRILGWIEDWIQQNPPGTDVAWDAYPTAQRLINWLLAGAMYGFDSELFRGSVAQQAQYLAKSLEYDLRANHLLQNAAGLTVAGCAVDGRLRDLGLQVLQRELAEQILPDGGHYERSPMYHVHVLFYTMLAYAALPKKPAALREAIERMTAFLADTLHTDGELPLFGDTVMGDTIPPAAIIAMSRRLTGAEAPAPRTGSYALPDSGFYVMAAPDNAARMIIKAGPPGPAYQLGHAHCDLLSYEFTMGTTRAIVDSGVHGYAESSWRDYCRSTRAHNTAWVEGHEQMECWDVFRVGRRYAHEPVQWDANAALGSMLHSGHNGFRPFRHERTIVHTREGFWLVLDAIAGSGRNRAISAIHLHPAVTWHAAGEGWACAAGDEDFQIVPFGHTNVEIAQAKTDPQQGWYCPRFGEAIPAPVILLHATGQNRFQFGYAIVPGLSRAPGRRFLMEYAKRLDRV